ncbi:7251_t:CDS:2 [Gigaspora margarita]|uniref:7251_t:CDS:1 n=1 Tax=Gigaspora margarita TaxID=4874 RepID=A0ABN7VE61_GIGMA|nr:7251_t:CDS:2 [Gigaspora margarita]
MSYNRYSQRKSLALVPVLKKQPSLHHGIQLYWYKELAYGAQSFFTTPQLHHAKAATRSTPATE